MVRGILFTLVVIVLLASAGPVLASGNFGNSITDPLMTLRDDAQETWTHLRDVLDTQIAGIWFGRIVGLFGMYALAAVLITGFNRFATATMDMVEHDPMHNIAYGFLGFVLTPVVVVLLALTLIGLPLAAGLLTLWTLLLLITVPFAGWTIGRFIVRHTLPHVSIPVFWEAVFGITLFMVVLEWLPHSGDGTLGMIMSGTAGVAKVFFLFWAAGAIIRTKRDALKKGYA